MVGGGAECLQALEANAQTTSARERFNLVICDVMMHGKRVVWGSCASRTLSSLSLSLCHSLTLPLLRKTQAWTAVRSSSRSANGTATSWR
jgi:CheY-like chemotaxis protein